MPLYRYIKAAPGNHFSRKHTRSVSMAFIFSGIVLLLWTVWPIVNFMFVNSDVFAKIITPVADGEKTLSPLSIGATAEFTNANAWYPQAPQKKVVTPVNTYALSIPKLGIQNATVAIGGDDLGVSLIHYGGTGLPGQYGTTVIFGHSTLPQFFSTTNYKTIFSLLPTMKVGDDIFVSYDDITYQYRVFDMVVLEPSDLSTLEQRFDDVYVTLVTCVPPGTYWKRLNVLARLVTPESGQHMVY